MVLQILSSHRFEPAVDAEHLLVGAEDELERKQPRDVELGVKAMGENPGEAVSVALGERGEACGVGGEVDRRRRPLVPLRSPLWLQRESRKTTPGRKAALRGESRKARARRALEST